MVNIHVTDALWIAGLLCQCAVREIIAMQDGLRALISRVNTVKDDCKKAEADNEMLQTYIDSVTKSLAAKERG